MVQPSDIRSSTDDETTKEGETKDSGREEPVSKEKIKGEDSEKTKDADGKVEAIPETATNSASANPAPSISGSDTPSSGRIRSSEPNRHDGESKDNTPQPRGIPRRPEPISSPGQPPPNLPNRPERLEPRHARPVDQRIPNRPPSNADSPRDRRDGRSHERGHSSRYGDNHQEPAEYPHSHSRSQEGRPERPEPSNVQSERARGEEHDRGPRHPPQDRRNQPPPRENMVSSWESERPGRARAPTDSPRSRLEQDRSQRERDLQENSMAPPRAPQTANTEVSNINPERAALISGGLGERDGISIRGQGEDRLTRSSRPTSPMRDYDSRHPSRSERREDRPATLDHRIGDFDPQSRDRHDSRYNSAPRGQHSDRQTRSGDGFPRDARHQPPHQYPPVDMNHGRLNQDDRTSSRHHERFSDRSEPPTDIPSGPRSRNPQPLPRGRDAPPLHTQNTQRSPPNSLPSTAGALDRPTPTGPASRSQTRGQSLQEQQNMSAPPTPSDTSGVHPDRLALVSPSTEAPPQRMPPYPTKPAPVQTSPSVPSGPRGNAPSGAPSGPAPQGRGPPSGPQGNNRNNRHPLAAVNNTLQQAGQGQSIRGRGSNRGSNGSLMSHSGPSTQITGPGQGPRSEVSMPSSQDQGRSDLFPPRGDDEINGRRAPQQHQNDLPPDRYPPSGRRGDLIDEAGSSGKRPSRHSAGGRTFSPDRNSPARRNERGPSSHKDRDSNRSDRDEEGRDYGRDRAREPDGGRGRRGEGTSDAPDRPREPSSRQRHDQQPPPPMAPQRRSSRRDVLSGDIPQSSSQPPTTPSSHGPPPPPHDDRGRRRGYPSDLSRGDEMNQRGSERDLRGRGPPPPRDPRGGGAGDTGDLPPRKHHRGEPEGAPYSGGGGGGRGGHRMASESKRPRRGG